MSSTDIDMSGKYYEWEGEQFDGTTLELRMLEDAVFGHLNSQDWREEFGYIRTMTVLQSSDSPAMQELAYQANKS